MVLISLSAEMKFYCNTVFADLFHLNHQCSQQHQLLHLNLGQFVFSANYILCILDIWQ